MGETKNRKTPVIIENTAGISKMTTNTRKNVTSTYDVTFLIV